MSHIADASTLPVTWRKSSYSDSGAQCVEFGTLDETTTFVRDSKTPTGPALAFGPAAIGALVGAVRDGAL